MCVVGSVGMLIAAQAANVPKIERAGTDDVAFLAGEAEQILKSFPKYQECPFDLQHTANTLNVYLNFPRMGCFFKRVEGALVGVIMGSVSSTMYSPRLELQELHFWVREDYRTTRLSLELLDTLETWARLEGAAVLHVSASTGHDTARVEKFYNKLGYRTTGVVCTKAV